VIAPSDIYPCADGKFMAVSPTGQQFWKQFCAAIGRPEMTDDPRFSHPKSRVANVGALTDILTEVFRSKTSKEWSGTFLAERIPAAPVNSVADAVAQPVAQLRKMVEELPHPGGKGSLPFLGNPFKYQPSQPLSYPPRHGADTRDILGRVCGYSPQAIDELVAKKVVFQGEVDDTTQ
jgi:crotonobetainyl-CoA:carnitine CoA-transferase CaiB-like acyl-CoA transferase